MLQRLLTPAGIAALAACFAALLGPGLEVGLAAHPHPIGPAAAGASFEACPAGPLETPSLDPRPCQSCLAAKSLSGWQVSAGPPSMALPVSAGRLDRSAGLPPVRRVCNTASRAPPQPA